MTGYPYRKVCEWCRLPKYADDDESECICDRPKYSMMDTCEDCGEYTDVDHLREREDGKHVCSRCDGVIA